MPPQSPLDLRDHDGKRFCFVRPMLGVESIRALTGLSEDEILYEALAGKILWAWNLANKTSDRIFLRVWNRSVLCWKDPELEQPQTISDVLNALLPHHRDTIRCSDLFRTFNTSSQHILNLVESSLLARVPGDIGPKDSPLVTRASLVEFLQTRRLAMPVKTATVAVIPTVGRTENA